MAQDYHIYIHGDSASAEHFKPFSSNASGSENINDGGIGAFTPQAINTVFDEATGQGQGLGNIVNTGVAMLSRAIPYVAIAIAVTKVADKVLTTGFSHQAEYQGNYKNSVLYNNAKMGIGNFLNPVKTYFMTRHNAKQMELKNMEIEQQNRLLGNTIIGNIKAGV